MKFTPTAKQQYDRMAYELSNEDGSLLNQTQILNAALEELHLFEAMSGDSVTDYIQRGWPSDYEEYMNNKNKNTK